jgi:hypothetical protein
MRRQGNILIIAMILTGLISMAGIYLLDAVMPPIRSVQGITNANGAYYQARSAMEQALYEMSRDNPSYERIGSSGSTTGSGSKFSIAAANTTVPTPGSGTSDFDADWNRLGKYDPVELRIDRSDIDFNNVKIDFRVPNVSGTGSDITKLSGTGNLAMITWILSGDGKTLVSNDNGYITLADINASEMTLGTRIGIYGTGSTTTFEAFYSNNPASTNGLGNCSNSTPCFLKFTLNRTLEIDPDSKGVIRSAPYLEYRITGLNAPIAEQFATITTRGYFGGYARETVRKLEQFATNTSINFTIFK